MRNFTFWLSPSLRLSPSAKFGLRPNIGQKMKSFFVWTWQSLSVNFWSQWLTETKFHTERLLSQNLTWTHQLILHARDRFNLELSSDYFFLNHVNGVSCVLIKCNHIFCADTNTFHIILQHNSWHIEIRFKFATKQVCVLGYHTQSPAPTFSWLKA